MSRSTKLPSLLSLCIVVATAAADPRAAATVREKARAVNTGGTMGCLEEIGSLPRTACELFEAGGASGSILAAHATYGKGASRALYGNAKRFVSRERLDQILDHLFDEARRFARQPGDEVPPATRLFAFANTVATGPYSGGGWAGIRFASPGKAPDQLEVCFRVIGPAPGEQPMLCGKLGVNLIHAAFYASKSPAELLPALMTEIGPGAPRRGYIRALRASGPGLELLLAGCSEHVFMTREGASEPGDLLHGKAVLLQRGPEPLVAPAALAALIADEHGVPAVATVPLLPVLAREPDRARVLTAQAAALERAGTCLLSRVPDAEGLGHFLAGATRAPVLVEGTLADARTQATTDTAPTADVRWIVPATALDVPADKLDTGRVIAVENGAAWVPLRRLGSLLDALGRAPAPAAKAPVYQIPATGEKAEADLTPGQVTTLRAHVARGLVAYRPR